LTVVRPTSNPSEVIRFGVVHELHRAAYDRQQARTAPCIERVGADGLFAVVEERPAASAWVGSGPQPVTLFD
jgi:hypothetical protein